MFDELHDAHRAEEARIGTVQAQPGQSFSIENLVVRVAQGDHAAFRALYDASGARLMAQALYIVRQSDVAEDVLQDAFVRIWMGAKDFDPQRGSAMAWLTWVLRNTAIDFLRKQRVAARYHADADAAAMLASPAVPIDHRIDLTRGFRELPKAQMQAVIAIAVEGHTHREAAAEFLIPVPTSKARVARGLQRIRTYLSA
jgi:RNA polymerase sigma-70 factor (ECF subfamily)